MDGGLFDGIRYAYTAKPAQDANAGARRGRRCRRQTADRTSPSVARPGGPGGAIGRFALDTDAFSLTDAAEELSLGMAHKVEEKHHTERKFAPERRVASSTRTKSWTRCSSRTNPTRMPSWWN